MGKETRAMAAEDRDKALAAALSQIEKQFGKGSVMRMGEHVDMGIEAIPTGALSLDLALGIGGLPRGRIVELFGPESSGKSTLAMHVVAEAQRNGGICAYIDAEHAMDPTYARAIGVNVDDLLVSQPDTGEQALEIADMLIRSGAIDVIVIDSVAALTPRAEIEGEMGDSHVGLQARLMSQALRKLAGTLNKSNTIAIFINQLREKIGVLYGCFSYGTRVVLADGSTEKIGKIVRRRMPVEVLSYDPGAGEVVAKPVVNWFDNGRTDEFLQFTVATPSGSGRARFATTRGHLVRTPAGWKEAGSLSVGDRVLQAVQHRLSSFQWEALRGMLLGEGTLSECGGRGARLRFSHREADAAYADWKASLFANVGSSRRVRERDGAVTYDFEPLPELAELHRTVWVDGKKVFDEDFLKHLTPLSLALWNADDVSSTAPPKDPREPAQGGTGCATIRVEAMEPATRERLVAYLRDVWGICASLLTDPRAGKAFLWFSNADTVKLHALVAPYVHPSVDRTLLPAYRGRFEVEPHFVPVRYELEALPVLDIEVKRPKRPMHRFDIEVEGAHTYLVDGVVVHNSPEVTPGGRALKFYASVRLDIRRTESIKDGADVIGNRTRVKVVKNKCVAEGTEVFDPSTGRLHRIEDIVERGEGACVVAADKLGRLRVRPIVARLEQGEREVIGLALRDGTVLWVTRDHEVLTDRGWRQAGELMVGDRLARPRRAFGFGAEAPVAPGQARMLGSLIGDGGVADVPPIPAAFFDPEVSAEVVANLLAGIWESCGDVTLERTGGGVRCGFTTTSEQLAHQVHWLLLRFGIGSSVRHDVLSPRRASVTEDRSADGEVGVHEVRIEGIEEVVGFAQALPLRGPKGARLAESIATRTSRSRGGSSRGYLSRSQIEPVLAYLKGRGVTAALAARLIGSDAGDPKRGMRGVLGHGRLRRDRVEALARALESPFLHEVLGEEVWYDRITAVRPAEQKRVYDIEVAEDHTFVANDVVVSNCSAPFKQAEFDIMFGSGISREGSLLDVAVDLGLVRKSGAWFTYEGEQLGQGRENVKTFLRENPQLMAEIDDRVRQQLTPRGQIETATAGAGAEADDLPITLE